MIDHHSIFLLVSAAVAVIGLILLITVVKLNPFLTLFLASLALALVTGMSPAQIVHSFELGMGGTLGHIAIVVALGTMIGKMMAESGGADQIAHTLVRFFGEKNIHWAMVFIGLVVGLPAFFEVGFVLLVPIVFNIARRTGTPLLMIGLPLVAGLSTVHGLVPPHPAAMMAVDIFKADVGRTILYALAVGVPTALIAGPLFAKLIVPHIVLSGENSIAAQFVEEEGTERSLPGFWLTLLAILLPVLLMLMGSWANAIATPKSTFNSVLHLIGNDDMALLIGVLFSFVTLGTMRGFNRETLLRFSNECLAPTAAITLLIGGGAGFGRILQDSGVSNAIIGVALHFNLPVLWLAWLLAAMMRLAVGSSTVAMATTAAIIAPIALHTSASPELLAIATGAGSLFFSHVNDGGFWLVKEYFGMSVSQTLKTWSVSETIISVTAMLFTVALSHVV